MASRSQAERRLPTSCSPPRRCRPAPLGVLEILHLLVLLGGRELPELVLWAATHRGPGWGRWEITSAALGLVLGSDISWNSL